MNICELNPKKPEWKKYVEMDRERDRGLIYKATIWRIGEERED